MVEKAGGSQQARRTAGKVPADEVKNVPHEGGGTVQTRPAGARVNTDPKQHSLPGAPAHTGDKEKLLQDPTGFPKRKDTSCAKDQIPDAFGFLKRVLEAKEQAKPS